MTKIDLPVDKFDIAAAERIVELGMPEIEPVLDEVLEWMADLNWPVATVLVQVFDGMGLEVVPHICEIFKSKDESWKYWMIVEVIPRLSLDAKSALREEILRIAEIPTKPEIREGLDVEAREYLMNEKNS